MGQVFRAAHAQTGDVVAPEAAQARASRATRGLIRRLLREARAAGAVEHRHLVGVLDAGQADGRHYLALELVPGVTVGQRIDAEGPLPLDDVVRIAAGRGRGARRAAPRRDRPP